MMIMIGMKRGSINNGSLYLPFSWRKLYNKKIYCCISRLDNSDDPSQLHISCFYDEDDRTFFANEIPCETLFECNIDKRFRFYIPKKFLTKCEINSTDTIYFCGHGVRFQISPVPRIKVPTVSFEELENIFQEFGL